MTAKADDYFLALPVMWELDGKRRPEDATTLYVYATDGNDDTLLVATSIDDIVDTVIDLSKSDDGSIRPEAVKPLTRLAKALHETARTIDTALKG